MRLDNPKSFVAQRHYDDGAGDVLPLVVVRAERIVGIGGCFLPCDDAEAVLCAQRSDHAQEPQAEAVPGPIIELRKTQPVIFGGHVQSGVEQRRQLGGRGAAVASTMDLTAAGNETQTAAIGGSWRWLARRLRRQREVAAGGGWHEGSGGGELWRLAAA